MTVVCIHTYLRMQTCIHVYVYIYIYTHLNLPSYLWSWQTAMRGHGWQLIMVNYLDSVLPNSGYSCHVMIVIWKWCAFISVVPFYIATATTGHNNSQPEEEKTMD